jgi:hypothetical protein
LVEEIGLKIVVSNVFSYATHNNSICDGDNADGGNVENKNHEVSEDEEVEVDTFES